MISFARLSQFRVPPLVPLTVALLAVSFSPIFIRWSETDLGPNATSYNRLFIFLVVFGVGQLGSGPPLAPSTTPISRSQWILLASLGVFSSLSLVLWAGSLQYTSVAKSMLLSNLTPLFTTFGSWLVLGRRIDQTFLMGMLLALMGAVGMGLEDLQQASGQLTGDLLAITSATFLGSYFLIVELLRDRFSSITILLWRCAVGSLLLAPAILMNENQIFPTTLLAWSGVLGLALICEGLGQRLLAESMKTFSCGFISVFLLLEPVISALLAWILFVEALSPMTWVGFTVILAGVYLAKSSTTAQKAESPLEMETPDTSPSTPDLSTLSPGEN